MIRIKKIREIVVEIVVFNRRLPSWLLPLCQNESSCKNDFRTQVHFRERFCTKIRFETEAQRNSETAYQVWKVISQLQKSKRKEFSVVVQEEGNFCKGTLLYLFEV